MARSSEINVRIGPVSLFTFIAVICLAVLAVLTTTTANASSVLSQRQAESKTCEYLAESSAQVFLANLDTVLVAGDGNVAAHLGELITAAEAAAPNEVTVTAQVTGNVVQATFVCENRRSLNIQLILDGRGYTVSSWKMCAVVNEAQDDALWTGNIG